MIDSVSFFFITKNRKQSQWLIYSHSSRLSCWSGRRNSPVNYLVFESCHGGGSPPPILCTTLWGQCPEFAV